MFKLWPGQAQFMTILTFDPCDLDHQPTYKCFKWHFSYLRTTTVQNYFWNPCINVQVMVRTSLIYDHFDLYLTPVILTFKLPEKMFQMAHLLLGGNNCAELFWNPCINVQVMLRTSLIYDHFDLYLTPVILTFKLPEKMFQMAHFLLGGNNCAELFWNPCINVQVMLRTSSIHVFDHLTFILPLWPWPSTYLKKRFKWHFSSSRATTVLNCFEIHALLYKLWSRQIRTEARTHWLTDAGTFIN